MDNIICLLTRSYAQYHEFRIIPMAFSLPFCVLSHIIIILMEIHGNFCISSHQNYKHVHIWFVFHSEWLFLFVLLPHDETHMNIFKLMLYASDECMQQFQWWRWWISLDWVVDDDNDSKHNKYKQTNIKSITRLSHEITNVSKHSDNSN